jgi:hypothetical protein
MARKVLNGLDLSNKQIANLADGSAPTDAVTKQQLDQVIRNIDWKQEVVAASTANVSLAAPGTSLDGVTLAANDRVLLKDQTAPAENGIYVWTAAGSALTRALDADSGAELSGSTVTVQRGTVNADRVYRVTADDPITLNTTAITFVQVGAGSSPYTAGNGLTLTGQDFNVGQGAGIVVTADAIAVDTAVVTRKSSASCVATTNPQTFAHTLGTQDVQVAVREVSTNKLVMADVTITDTSNVSVDFGGAPTAGQYRVTIQG